MAHVLVIDDDRSLLELLEGYLQRQDHLVTTAASGQAGLDAFAAGGADIVLLDVTMHGLDGWQVLARLREASDVPIIMLTARSDEPEILRGFAGGADDYVSKPFSFAQLVARIGAVLDRTGRASEAGHAVLRGGDLEVDVDRHRVFRAGEPIDLTATEFRILAALLRQKGRVVSTRELVIEVWGSEYAEETGYVRRYVWHLRRKLEPDPQHPRYILNERSFGYVFPADPSP
jgi:DNA-binding response OmpR family regulator